MSVSFRVFYSLALSLSLINPVLGQSQSSSSALDSIDSTQSPAEAAVRGVVERYFALWASKDLDGLMSLWSEKSPDYASLKQNVQRQITTEEYRPSLLTISRVKVEGEKASLRAMVNITATDLKSNQKREQQIARNFALVREDENWKVWRYAPAENDLAEAMVKAKTEAERAILLAEEKELVTSELVRAVGSQGDRSYGQGNFPQALAIHRLAQKLAEQLDDKSGLARALNSLGNAHWAQGDYAPALHNFQHSLALSQMLNDQAAVAGTLRNLGNLQYVQGNWDQAAGLFRQGLRLSETLGDRLGVARGLGSLGVVADSQGDFAQALAYYRQSLEQFQALEDTTGIARTLGNIAIVYEEQGNYAQALAHHQKSLLLFEAKGDQAGSARTLHNIAIVHLDQGNYAQALDYSQRSLRLREALGDRPGKARTLAHLGNIHYEQGHYAQALEYHQQSLALRQALNDREGVANTLNSIGGIEAEQGNYEQAQEHVRQSLALCEALGFKLGMASALGFLSSIHQKQGQYTLALDFASRAAAIARQIGNTNRLRQVRFTAGTAHRALKQHAQARVAFEEAVAIIETMRSNVAGGGEEQQRFFESKVSPYHAMVELLTREGRPAEALIFAERAKARVLLDVLQTGRVNVTKAMTSQEQEQEGKLNGQLVSLNTQISRETARRQPDQARLTELKAHLKKARLDFEAFQTNLYATHPELRTQRGEGQPLKLEEATALLPDSKSALLEYVVTDDQTYLFATTKMARQAEADVQVYMLPIKRDELTKQAEAFRQQLAGRDLGFRASAVKLYELLLKPAQAQLKGKTNLVIVPDDKLWDLPFQALLASANRFLIEDAAIAYAPSLTVLREMTKRRKNQNTDALSATLLALGNPLLGRETIERATLVLRDAKFDPLPEAEQEVRALGQLYGSPRSKIYVGPEAREDRVKTEAGQARTLHFATHGTLNNASPMYSHLVLTPGNQNEDGLLEAWELMQMDLKADLAVLSACETARGRYGAGEGMIGLTWAMFVAGVPSTVVSQWKVESASTRDLMVSFHRGINSTARTGKTKATKSEALRQAALKLLKNPETSHPFYWAGFVLVGDGR